MAVAEVALVEEILTLMENVVQEVVLQIPSYLTKYVVEEDGDTETIVPVPTNVPPQ